MKYFLPLIFMLCLSFPAIAGSDDYYDEDKIVPSFNQDRRDKNPYDNKYEGYREEKSDDDDQSSSSFDRPYFSDRYEREQENRESRIERENRSALGDNPQTGFLETSRDYEDRMKRETGHHGADTYDFSDTYHNPTARRPRWGENMLQ